MQAADLAKYIHDPKLLDKESVAQLQKLVVDFPYFQSAHILLSMASKKWDASIYQQSLKKTAIVSTNRAHLFKLIHDLEKPEVEEKTNPEGNIEQATLSKKEEAKQELQILQAAELATEMMEEKAGKAEEKNKEKNSALDAEQALEREIGKEVVTAFVEKEILKTTELNRPVVREEKPESFTDWLSFLKKNNGQPYEQIAAQVKQEKANKEAVQQEVAESAPKEKEQVEQRKLKNKALIDKIIENSPGLIRPKEDQRFYAPDLKAKESLLENEHLVTETLAKIYALQGSVSKAIRAYEILSMKFPQKRAYFDNLIHKLKHNS